MPLSWNEIKSRAVTFSKEWENETDESAESQTFLNEFFEVFGITRKRVATFEKPVRKIDGRDGYIDLLWPGKILIEHKSKGKNLEKAKNQAIAYSFGLTEEELPRYILVCDFNRFTLYDLEENKEHSFTIEDFVKNVKLFGFIAGYFTTTFKEEDPVNINPYLVDFKDILIKARSSPICDVPVMNWGSKPVDGGNFLFTDAEKDAFLKLEPNAKAFFKPLISASEFLKGENRWCLWLNDIEPKKIKELKLVLERVENVKQFRLASKKKPTQEAAKYPTMFAELRQPESDYIFFPLTKSENRKYIPLDFFSKNYIINNSASYIPEATVYHFGVLTSEMHMTWVKYVCGRLESRYRYSSDIAYNNFPWPENFTEKQIKTVEEKAQKVLDVRKDFPNSSLADLYDPLTMPPALVKAHQELDKAVDLCYRPQPFPNETKRIEFLFELYEKYTQPLLNIKKPVKKKK